MIVALSETEKAYLAGILDGEGHIRIESRELHRGNKVYSNSYLSIGITNTNSKLMDWLKCIGGAVQEIKPDIGHFGRKPVFRWTIRARQAGELLTQVALYLIIKKEQAEAAIYFQSLRKPHGRGKQYERTEMDKYLDGLLRNKINVRGGE